MQGHTGNLPLHISIPTAGAYYRLVSSLMYTVEVCWFDSRVTPGPFVSLYPTQQNKVCLPAVVHKLDSSVYIASVQSTIRLTINLIALHQKDTAVALFELPRTKAVIQNLAGEKYKVCVAGRRRGSPPVTARPACHAAPKMYPRAEAPL